MCRRQIDKEKKRRKSVIPSERSESRDLRTKVCRQLTAPLAQELCTTRYCQDPSATLGMTYLSVSVRIILPSSITLREGPCPSPTNRKEEAANRFLSFLLLDLHRRNESSGTQEVYRPPTRYVTHCLQMHICAPQKRYRAERTGSDTHRTEHALPAGAYPHYMSKGSMPRTGWPTSDR